MPRRETVTTLLGPPGRPSPEALRRAAVRWNEAQQFEREGRLDDAVAAYREAIQLDPSDADALVRLGLILRELGRGDEAHDAFAAAVALQRPVGRDRSRG